MFVVEVEWGIRRHGAGIRVWAVKTLDGWVFWDKEIGDVRWFRLRSTAELVDAAERRARDAAKEGRPERSAA